MKFCSKCGTQIPSNSQTCPQCEISTGEITSSISSEEPTPKKKASKLKIIIPLFTIAVVVVVAGFVAWSLPNPDPTSEPCPKGFDKYYHVWEPATCIEPATCSECGRYKDDKLASHHNWSSSSDSANCLDCNLYRQEYLDNN